MSEVIACDQCGDQLNVDSKYPHKWGFRLESRDYGVNTEGVVFAVAMRPHLSSPKDFCSMRCLRAYVTPASTGNQETGGEDA